MIIMHLPNISSPAMLCQLLGRTRNHVGRKGGGTMAQILPAPARSLKEFRLLPGYTPADGRVPALSLETKPPGPPHGLEGQTAEIPAQLKIVNVLLLAKKNNATHETRIAMGLPAISN